jgi:hypothetical protein
MTDTRERDQLLPCPFCGEKPAVDITGFHGGGRTIFCAGNDCMGPSTTAASFEDAAVQWNTRTPSPSATAMPGREELIAVIEAHVGIVERSNEKGRSIDFIDGIPSAADAILALFAAPPGAVSTHEQGGGNV